MYPSSLRVSARAYLSVSIIATNHELQLQRLHFGFVLYM